MAASENETRIVTSTVTLTPHGGRAKLIINLITSKYGERTRRCTSAFFGGKGKAGGPTATAGGAHESKSAEVVSFIPNAATERRSRGWQWRGGSTSEAGSIHSKLLPHCEKVEEIKRLS